MAHATLCFPDYATAVQAAKALGFWDMEEDRLKSGGQTINPDGTAFSWMVDEIGQVVDTPAVVDPETGDVLEPPTFKPGYYVNAIGDLPAAIEPFMVPYGSGGRIFAGIPADE